MSRFKRRLSIRLGDLCGESVKLPRIERNEAVDVYIGIGVKLTFLSKSPMDVKEV